MALDRNLASINHKLLKKSQILQSTIRDLASAGRTVSILEVGCGAGFALMELAWEFRDADVRFHAINKSRRPLATSEDLRRTALQLRLPEDEIQGMRLPELVLQDATSMPFEDDSFDLIYLSSVLRFVEHKAEFIEEVARVLRPGGVALVRAASRGWDYPYCLAEDGERLTSFPSRWVLKHGRELIPLDIYFKGIREEAFDFDFINRPACVIRMRKREAGRLSLGLHYDAALRGSMRDLPYGDPATGRAMGGMRSVYGIPRDSYERLVESGLLSGRAPSAAPMPRLKTSDASTHDPGVEQRERLSRWGIGQRVKVKGRRLGRRFRAAKIKMIRYDRSHDTLVGEIDRIDDSSRTIDVLGVPVDLSAAPPPGEGKMPRVLKTGMTVKVVGEYSRGRFLAYKIREVPRPAILVEVVLAPIEAIDAEEGALQVAGIRIETGADTKIDRVDHR